MHSCDCDSIPAISINAMNFYCRNSFDMALQYPWNCSNRLLSFGKILNIAKRENFRILNKFIICSEFYVVLCSLSSWSVFIGFSSCSCGTLNSLRLTERFYN